MHVYIINNMKYIFTGGDQLWSKIVLIVVYNV